MVEVYSYSQCGQCKVRIQSEFLHFHNCEDEAKIKEVEAQIQSALDENSKLKIQNAELLKSVESIKKEVNNSFNQMKDIVAGYVKKNEESKKVVTEVKEVVTEQLASAETPN